MIINLIRWYLEKRGWEYMIHNKNRMYIYSPDKNFKASDPSQFLHITAKEKM